MKKSLVSKVIVFTVSIFLFTVVGQPYFTAASTPNSYEDYYEDFFDGDSTWENLKFEDLDLLSLNELEDLGLNVEDGYDEINEEIFNDGFDFEAAVEELDIAKMDEEEEEEFLEIINEVAALSSTEEEELLVEALTGFFDSNSEVYNDLEATETQMIEDYIEKIESEENNFISSINKTLFGEEAYAAKKKGKIAIGVNLLGSIFNVAFAGLVGGGASAVKNLIKKKGKKVVAQQLSRVATAQAKKAGIKTVKGVAIATVIANVVYTALDYADVGGALAKLIDRVDWYPRNGWVDVTK
ncbi:hypothetical protein AB3N04_19915 [Alkalihalophilus sp. As8PL]|uniref:Uncharacterized protein n=1 Tax=Alkalihalophilus sp. As8PL TaxID=3237103 RepID=A0AB39BU22_9BACI